MSRKKLVSGHKLDLLITKKIYGVKFPAEREVRKVIKSRKINWVYARANDKYWARTDVERPWGFYFWKDDRGRIEYKFEVAHVSRDIAAAMQLAHFMRQDGFNFRMSQHGSYMQCGAPDGHAIVSFTCQMGPCKRHGNKLNNHHGAYDIEGDTVPLAICRAALIAKGVI
jgi:hypothetical protein